MKKKTLWINLFLIVILASLSSCAAGAATAGYAIKAQSADGLTAPAEQRIIDRAKKEMMWEMTHPQPTYCNQ